MKPSFGIKDFYVKMGLESVKEEILESAKAQASSLIAQARKEADRLMKEAEAKCEEIREKTEAQAKITIERLKRQEIAYLELEKKKMILESKKQMVESVFSQAKKSLGELSDKKRESLIKKLLEKVKLDIKPEYFCCNKRDVKFLKGMDAKPAEIIGGLIAEDKERKMIVDYSFETMLESVKDSQLQEISGLLFA